MGANNQMACDFCSVPYDPVATRWLCPNCHMKTNCCDGAPLNDFMCATLQESNRLEKF